MICFQKKCSVSIQTVAQGNSTVPCETSKMNIHDFKALYP